MPKKMKSQETTANVECISSSDSGPNQGTMCNSFIELNNREFHYQQGYLLREGLSGRVLSTIYVKGQVWIL